jgi:hypothetical protein
MSPRCVAITISVVLSVPAVPSMQAVSGQWLIQKVGGVWEVREKGQKDRRMSEKYDVITAGSQIRCVKAPCTLAYSADGLAKSLFPKPPALGQWIRVPQPSEPPVARTVAEMQQLIGRAGVRGGAEKGSPACSGDLPLLAPRCHETIEPTEFRLQWKSRPADAGKVYTLLIGSSDSSERRRWNAIAADSGEFRLKALQDYLADLQLPDRPTDITLRLMRTENLDAVRLVRLQSSADAAEHRRIVQGLQRLAELPRNLGLLEEYLKTGMSSKAADVSRTLLQDAPTSLEVRKYALIGLCGSDFAEEIAKLRSSLRQTGITGFCEAERAAR